MSINNSLAALGLLLPSALLAAAAPAQSPQPAGEAAPAAAPDPIRPVLGELTRLDGDRFEVKPWDPKLPKRLKGTMTPGARFFRQRAGKQRDLEPGDMVLVVQEVPQLLHSVARKQKSSLLQPESTGEAGDASSVEKARTVLRLWKVPADGPTTPDRALAHRLLPATEGFLPAKGPGSARDSGDRSGPDRNARRDPYEHAKTVVGVVRSVDPLIVGVGDHEQAFRVTESTTFVNNEPMDASGLKRGETVMLRSLTPPSTEVELQARVIVRCPPPKLSLAQTRRIILRERDHSDDSRP